MGMYSECGDVVGAENAFRCLKEHDVVSWTAMQVVYIKQGHGIEALWIYLKMQHEGIYPNQHTIAAGLRACAHIVDMDEKIFAGVPTNRSPFVVKATTEGVVRAPSEFSITLAVYIHINHIK